MDMSDCGTFERLFLICVLFHQIYLTLETDIDPYRSSSPRFSLVQKDYSWSLGHWSRCSVSCLQGSQIRSVECRNLSSEEDVVKDVFCPQPKPPSVQKCQAGPCPANWAISAWSSCSRTCGSGLLQRWVVCRQMLSPGEVVMVEDKDCLTPKPADTRACSHLPPCPAWRTSPWSECSKSCGPGVRRRSISCYQGDNKISNTFCGDEAQPTVAESCKIMPCQVNMRWNLSDWSTCSTLCGKGEQVREATCIRSEEGKALLGRDEDCLSLQKPETRRICSQVPCTIVWKITNTTECSTSCGPGTQKRFSVCVVDGEVVEDLACSSIDRPSPLMACSLRPCMTTTTTTRSTRSTTTTTTTRTTLGTSQPVQTTATRRGNPTTTSPESVPSLPSTSLNSTEPPLVTAQVVITSHDETPRKLGDSATFSCKNLDDPRATVTWYHNNQRVVKTDGRHVLLDGGVRLGIDDLRLEDQGSLVCVTSGRSRKDSVSTDLRVFVQPTTSVKPRYSTSVGGRLVLTCKVNGRPEPVVTWLKDLQEIPSELQGIRSENRLEFSPVSLSHAGTYTCIGSNPVGSSRARTVVSVHAQAPLTSCMDYPRIADCNYVLQNNYCRHPTFRDVCCASCQLQ